MHAHYRKTKTTLKKKERKINCSSIICVSVQALLDIFLGIFLIYE